MRKIAAGIAFVIIFAVLTAALFLAAYLPGLPFMPSAIISVILILTGIVIAVFEVKNRPKTDSDEYQITFITEID